MTSPRGFAVLAAAIAALALPATAAAKPKVTITGDSINNYAFSPSKVKVSKGAKVRWSWDSNAPHNVTFAKLGEHSPTSASGSYSLNARDQSASTWWIASSSRTNHARCRSPCSTT